MNISKNEIQDLTNQISRLADSTEEIANSLNRTDDFNNWSYADSFASIAGSFVKANSLQKKKEAEMSEAKAKEVLGIGKDYDLVWTGKEHQATYIKDEMFKKGMTQEEAELSYEMWMGDPCIILNKEMAAQWLASTYDENQGLDSFVEQWSTIFEITKREAAALWMARQNEIAWDAYQEQLSKIG